MGGNAPGGLRGGSIPSTPREVLKGVCSHFFPGLGDVFRVFPTKNHYIVIMVREPRGAELVRNGSNQTVQHQRRRQQLGLCRVTSACEVPSQTSPSSFLHSSHHGRHKGRNPTSKQSPPIFVFERSVGCMPIVQRDPELQSKRFGEEAIHCEQMRQ